MRFAIGVCRQHDHLNTTGKIKTKRTAECVRTQSKRMKKSPTNRNNISDKCNQACDKVHVKCKPLLARKMGSNNCRRSTGTTTVNPAATATLSTSDTPSALQANALLARENNVSEAHSSAQASFSPRHSFNSHMIVTFIGGASASARNCKPLISAHNPPASLHSSPSNEQCELINKMTNDAYGAAIADDLHGCTATADGGCSSQLASILSAFHATREPIEASETARETADTKIATTTKTHTAAMTVAPRTPTLKATPPTLAAGQLTEEKKSIASTTTITHAMTPTTTAATKTSNEQTLTAAVTTAREGVHSSVTRRAQSAPRLTSPSRMGDEQVEGVLTAVDAKSKFTENKCPLAVLTNVSNQRKVEASTTISAPEQCTLNSNNSNLNEYSDRTSEVHATRNKWPAAVSLINSEYDPACKTTTPAETSSSNSKDIIRALNLAARKAKLKSEFFRDFETHEQAVKRLTETTSLIGDCGTSCKNQNFRQLQLDAVSTRCTADIQIGLHTGLPTIAVNAAETYSPTSLVARRKLDLKQKFEQQTATRTSHHLLEAHNALIDTVGVFPRVEELVQKFESKPTSSVRKMIVHPNKSSEVTDNNMLSLKPDRLEQRNSPLSDEGCNLGQSPYSSDNEDNESAQTTATAAQTKRKDKVARSASSDSALGLEVEESMDTTPAQPPVGPQQRRMTLTVTDLPLRPALLPLAEPTALPDTTIIELPPTINNLPAPATVPSKVLLEERVVELPEDPRSLAPSQPCSRRESAQSCGSDTVPTEFPGGRRFVRTPSVVVSDYSDEIMCGITLEEIEYFRAQRMRRRHSSLDTANEGEGESDVSASSSCSNLYYCGSTISALDGAECYVNGVRTALDRKASDCSTCSASAEEDTFTIPEDPQQTGKDLSDILAAQHLSAKPAAKKVGLVVPMGENLGEKAPY